MPRALNRRDLSNARFREEVIAKYMSYLSNEMIAQAQKELKGKHLICWRSPQTCHADVLLRAANGEFAK